MADFENENPESHDFINVDKPEAEVVPAETTEPEPEVTSTTASMDPTQPEAEEQFEKQPKEETPEVPDEKPAVADEKTAPEADSTSSSRELTSFPARWMKERNVDQRVIDLIYWRNIKKTAVVFSTVLVVLISLSVYSLLSVVTFFSMAVLTVALLYRVGMTVMGAIQKSGAENPFKKFLDKDIEISKEKASECVECAVGRINCGTKKLRRLFLVEDIVDSIKDKIDDVLKTVHSQVKSVIEQAKSKLPEKLRPKEKTT
ncbi:hypothetical protein QZH41_011752 [Actinostola sp. cb2023]|nr:hypothetical protein QZH41_011752 [Actinostola sp. cb2023]